MSFLFHSYILQKIGPKSLKKLELSLIASNLSLIASNDTKTIPVG